MTKLFVRGLAVAMVLGGCSESHVGGPLDDAGTVRMDSGITIVGDGGGAVRDTGVRMPGDAAIELPDTGGLEPIDAGPRDDAAGPGPIDAGPGPGTDAGTSGVACGGATCTAPQICCVTFGMGGTSTMTCSDESACMGVAAMCDGPEDCASTEACCAMRGGGGGGGPGGGGTTTCVSDAMCRFGRLCHADTDCTGTDTCCSFMGANICTPFCP